MYYSRCTTNELQKFAKERKLTVVLRTDSAKSKREDLIEALLRADEHPPTPFRFFDLPAELKNRIYEPLLDNGRLATAHPRMIRTCRQIYQEASTILYGANVFTMKISPSSVHINGRNAGGHSFSSSGVHLDGAAVFHLRWPAVLKKVAHLKIVFSSAWHSKITPRTSYRQQGHCKDNHREHSSATNQILWSLSLFLTPENKLKRVTIDVASMLGRHPNLRPYDNCTCIESAFRPLRLLPLSEVNKVDFGHTTSQEAIDTIQSLWNEPSWTLSHNIPLQKWSEAIKKAKICWELSEEIDICDQYDDMVLHQRRVPTGNSSNPEMDRINRRSGEITSTLYPGTFIDRGKEASLAMAITALRGHLSTLDLKQLRAQAEETAMAKAKRHLEKMEVAVKELE